MAASTVEFLKRYPEFETAGVDQLTAVLAEAETQTSDSWGDRYDEMVYLQMAIKLAASPFGRNARMSSKDGSSTYSKRWDVLILGHGCARGRVA